MLNNENRPSVEEQYSQACTSSNLGCDTRDGAPTGSTGLLIAAGWNKTRIGNLLMRLHTKADRHALEQSHEQITIWATRQGIQQPATVAASVLGWWLKNTCNKCDGVKFELIAGTPIKSPRVCKLCHGQGKHALPCGEAGKVVERFIDECTEHAQAFIGKGLRNRR